MDTERVIKIKTLLESTIIAQKQQDQKLIELKNELAKYNDQASLYKEAANYIVSLLKKIRQHEDDKKIAAYSLIEDSLQQISSIIPASRMENVGLFIENGKLFLVNKETNQTIKMVEGDAVNSIVCLIMRHIVITNNPEFSNFIYLDEGLSTVGHSNIAALKILLKELAKNCLIIITEQKHDVTEDIADIVYTFEKPSDNEPTKITREDIRDD